MKAQRTFSINYKVETSNLVENGIHPTEEQADEKEIFKNFSDAKKSYQNWIKANIREFKDLLEYSKTLKKSDL